MRHVLFACAASVMTVSTASAQSANAPTNDPQAAAVAARAAAAYDANAEEAKNMRLVGAHDLAARTAYQPTIKRQGERWILYVGHHGGRDRNPLNGAEEENGTSILDVTNPREPRLLFHIPGERGRVVPGRETGGAQMTRVCGGGELPKADPSKFYLLRTFGDSGQEIFDVTKPEEPKRVWSATGVRSTHKNYWECDTGIAYLVNTGDADKWRIQRVTHIYDLSNPEQPVKIREYSLPEHLKTASGAQPAAIHGPISGGPGLNRVFFGYGTNRGGVAQIVDREKLLKGTGDITEASIKDAEIGRVTLPNFVGAHTVFPLYGMDLPRFAQDKTQRTRNFVAIVNESNVTACGEARQLVYFADVTDEKRPIGVSTYEPDERSGKFCERGGRFGAHASHENMNAIYHKRLMFFSWFNAGVRIVDVRDPFMPKEVGYYIPARNKNTDFRCDDEKARTGCVPVIQINNMEVDDRGYVYAVDRANSGLFILEVTGEARAIADFSKAVTQRASAP